MLQVDIDKITPVTEARDNLNKIVEEVDNSDVMHVLTKNGTPVAVIVGVNHLEKLTGEPFEGGSTSGGSAITTQNSNQNDDKSDGKTEPETKPIEPLAVPALKEENPDKVDDKTADLTKPEDTDTASDLGDFNPPAGGLATPAENDDPKSDTPSASPLPGSAPVAPSPAPAANDDLFSDLDQPTTSTAPGTDNEKKSIFDDDLPTAPDSNPTAPAVNPAEAPTPTQPVSETPAEPVTEAPAVSNQTDSPLAATPPAMPDEPEATPAPVPNSNQTTSFEDFVTPPTTPGITGGNESSLVTDNPAADTAAPASNTDNATSAPTMSATPAAPEETPASQDTTQVHPNYSFDQTATTDSNQAPATNPAPTQPAQ